METSQDEETKDKKKPRDPIASVCSSSALDKFLSEKKDLKVTYNVPRSFSVEYVSDFTTTIPITQLEPKVL